jgi:ribosome hibernation promoting factor
MCAKVFELNAERVLKQTGKGAVMMNVDVRMHQVDLANALRSYLEKRLRLKLGRHADRVRTLKLRLNDEGGATDGTATVCFLAAQLVPSGEVIVMETSPDLYSAVSRAVERLKKTLRRKIEKKRSARRTRESIRSLIC